MTCYHTMKTAKTIVTFNIDTKNGDPKSVAIPSLNIG